MNKPLTPREPTEAQFTRQVIALAQLHGWKAAHFRPALTKSGKWRTAVQGDGKGFPDLILVKDGHSVIAAELKVWKKPPTPDQTEWLVAFGRAGASAYIWRPVDWPEIERILKR